MPAATRRLPDSVSCRAPSLLSAYPKATSRSQCAWGISPWASHLLSSRREANSSLLNQAGGSRAALLSFISEIQAAQDDTPRDTLEFPCDDLLSSSLFNPIAQSHELLFALLRLGLRRFLQVIHSGCTDGAAYFPLTVHHREQDHHPIKFITAKTAACQCHPHVPPVLCRPKLAAVLY